MNKTIIIVASLSLALASCQTLHKGDYKSIHRGLDVCTEEHCRNLDEKFEEIASRYDRQGAFKGRDLLVKAQRNWLEYRQRECKYASESCYRRLTEERLRFFDAQYYLSELGLPHCSALSGGFPDNSNVNDGLRNYEKAVSLSNCETKCAKGEIANAKKYPGAWAYCQFDEKTIMSYNIKHPESLEPLPFLPPQGFGTPLDTE